MTTPVPPIHYWNAGDDMNASRMNEIADTINWMRDTPMVHVGRTLTNQATSASSALNTASFDTLFNSYDPYDMWDPAAPTVVTAQVSGWYDIEYGMVLSLDANAGRVSTGVFRNGDTANTIDRCDMITAPNLGGNLGLRRNTVNFLTAGDTLSMQVIYNTTVARNLLAVSASECPRLRLKWISS